jgi:hypothetical protein
VPDGARVRAWRDRRTDPVVAFSLDGRRYVVPDRAARVWVLAVLSDDPADWLLNALEEEVAEELWECAVDPDHPITPELLHDIGRSVVERVAERPWWQVTRLVASLVEQWAVLDGLAADRGLGDPLDWSLSRLLSWVYIRLTDGADATERAKIDRSLDAPVTVPGAARTQTSGDDAAGWLAVAASTGARLDPAVVRRG